MNSLPNTINLPTNESIWDYKESQTISCYCYLTPDPQEAIDSDDGFMSFLDKWRDDNIKKFKLEKLIS